MPSAYKLRKQRNQHHDRDRCQNGSIILSIYYLSAIERSQPTPADWRLHHQRVDSALGWIGESPRIWLLNQPAGVASRSLTTDRGAGSQTRRLDYVYTNEVEHNSLDLTCMVRLCIKSVSMRRHALTTKVSAAPGRQPKATAYTSPPPRADHLSRHRRGLFFALPTIRHRRQSSPHGFTVAHESG